jgi:hypothetical protein
MSSSVLARVRRRGAIRLIVVLTFASVGVMALMSWHALRAFGERERLRGRDEAWQRVQEAATTFFQAVPDRLAAEAGVPLPLAVSATPALSVPDDDPSRLFLLKLALAPASVSARLLRLEAFLNAAPEHKPFWSYLELGSALDDQDLGRLPSILDRLAQMPQDVRLTNGFPLRTWAHLQAAWVAERAGQSATATHWLIRAGNHSRPVLPGVPPGVARETAIRSHFDAGAKGKGAADVAARGGARPAHPRQWEEILVWLWAREPFVLPDGWHRPASLSFFVVTRDGSPTVYFHPEWGAEFEETLKKAAGPQFHLDLVALPPLGMTTEARAVPMIHDVVGVLA